MTGHGSPPRRHARPPAPARRRAGAGGDLWDAPPAWDARGDLAGEDLPGEDPPPWAGPPLAPPRPGHGARREGRGGPRASRSAADDGPAPRPAPRGSRAVRARARGRRRARVMAAIWAGAAVTVAVIAAAVLVLVRHHAPARPAPGRLVTTFQRGELKTVPAACSSVSKATLGTYLPGKRSMIRPRSLYGAAQSVCDWTLDQPPAYRLLTVTVMAYAPSGLAGGDGSATAAAEGAYAQALRQRASPPKAVHLPRAVITRVPGLGAAAFAALQVVRAGGDRTDMLTVVARTRNVLVTALLEGLDHSANGRYGPVSPAQLRAGATAASRDVLARVQRAGG